MANRSKRTNEKDTTFLDALRGGGTVSEAAEAAGYGRRTVYEWRQSDDEFRAQWDDAYDEGTDALERVAAERAKDKSDTLLIFLLKARRPEKFAERQRHEVSGPDGGPVEAVSTIRFVSPDGE